jgi:hypothetical protein
MIRRIVFVLSVLVVVGAVLYYWPVSSPTGAGRATGAGAGATGSSQLNAGASKSTSPAGVTATNATAAAAVPPGVAKAVNLETDFPIVAPLNAPGSTVMRDLDVVSRIFDAWQGNFPREGNPVGENAEITAALMGENRLGLALIPKGHPAVNAQGELCDRWGTPFRFHQLSGSKMEIRSAGPDRKFATDDDAVWTPQ